MIFFLDTEYLFFPRALARTLDDGSTHVEQRKNVVNYMLNNREDFEPFVENDLYVSLSSAIRSIIGKISMHGLSIISDVCNM